MQGTSPATSVQRMAEPDPLQTSRYAERRRCNSSWKRTPALGESPFGNSGLAQTGIEVGLDLL